MLSMPPSWSVLRSFFIILHLHFINSSYHRPHYVFYHTQDLVNFERRLRRHWLRETHDSGFCLNGLPSTQLLFCLYKAVWFRDIISNHLFAIYYLTLWIRSLKLSDTPMYQFESNVRALVVLMVIVFIINTVRPSYVHRCLGTGSWPLHVMACRPFTPNHSLNLYRLNYRHVPNDMGQWNVKPYTTFFNEGSIDNSISNESTSHPGFTVLMCDPTEQLFSLTDRVRGVYSVELH